MPFNHNIGITLTTLSGNGLSYRYEFNKRIEAQISGIALQSKEEEYESWFYSNIGTELQIGLPLKASSFGIERVYGILGDRIIPLIIEDTVIHFSILPITDRNHFLLPA